MEPREQKPEPLRQPAGGEHPVDPTTPASTPEGWRPSDAEHSPTRIGAPESERSEELSEGTENERDAGL